jgi:hypothetical protein
LRRRSSRHAARLNGNGKRESSVESLSQWRGERRSARIGAAGAEFDTDPPPSKRARTEDSMDSGISGENNTNNDQKSGSRLRNGAAGLKKNEVALEQIPGKKRSRFWVYAVETAPKEATQEAPVDPSLNGTASSEASQIDDQSLAESQSATSSASTPAPEDQDMEADYQPPQAISAAVS